MEARDRTRNPKGTPTKASRWPRTDRREQRVYATLRHRQPDLTVVLEDVHDPHNVSAVLRSCDAVGVLDVHLVYIHEELPRRAFARSTSGSAAKWLRTFTHESVENCYTALRKQGCTILVSALGIERTTLFEIDLTQPVALVFGNEHRGVSATAVTGADGTFVIPMMGMVQSLNISVACAVTLFEAMRQRQAADAYETQQLDEELYNSIAAEWLKK